MRCPFCDQGLAADAAECPACRLTFPRTASLLGVAPRFIPGVSDMMGALLPHEEAKLRRRIEALRRDWPQVFVQLVIQQFPLDHPFGLYAFWFFNSCAFAGANKRGRDNHTLMLLVDPSRGEGAIIPGYGLEPLISRETLDHLLARACDSWQHSEWAAGFHAVLEVLPQVLEAISEPEAPEFASGDF